MNNIEDVEDAILKQAMDAFHHETGLVVRVIDKHRFIEGQYVDAVVAFQNVDGQLVVQLKRWAQQINLGALVNQIQQLPQEGLLIADYVNPNMAQKLKAQGVQFMDTVGNAYINKPPIYVYVTGHKQKKAAMTAKDTNRAFDATGLKVVFGLLSNPTLVHATYRDIAEQTGVALGSVAWVMNGLKDAGLLIDRGRGKQRRLVNKRKILERWVEAYPEKLQPKQRLGEYIADDPTWWKNIDIGHYHGYWGGEVAAAEYTEYINPQMVTLYLPEHAGFQLLAKARLRKRAEWLGNEEGVVRIYRPFWPQLLEGQTGNHEHLVHPIVVYADLIATGDTRNIETARMIYEQYIAEYIGED